MKRTSILLSILVGMLALSLTGCPQRVRIADINKDPGRYYDREVTVVGHVNRSYGVAGKGVYEIDDGTGRMWVFTEKYGVPGKDGYIGVSGHVVPGVTYEGRNYATVLRETRRRTHPTS